MKRIAQLLLTKAHRRLCSSPSMHPLPKVPELLIFDFDGTIADTFQNGLDILNELAPEFGYRPLFGDDVEAARNMTTRQLMRFLGISLSRLPAISFRGVKLLHSRMHRIHPISGIPAVLHKLRESGFSMGILTSNSEENVTAFLRRHHLEIFSFIRSSSRLFGKAHEINTILRSYSLAPQKVIFIGDETRDIEAAHRSKVPIVAVGWGYNTSEALRAQKPQALVEHPSDLLTLLLEG
ncbi:MAG: carotenoid oxygenase [Verrucomicrobia bacterium]|nr:MAG: carotenoid oxygenase [Verrucomicrobiota bacterium]